MTVTTADKLTIVKLFAAGRDREFVAAAVSHDADTVVRAASAYGYPDTAKLAWAADVLQKQIDDEARAAVPASTVRPPAPRLDTPPAARPSPGPRPVAAAPASGAPRPAGPPNEVRAAIALGLKSDRARIRRLAEKARDAVDTLTTALAEDEAARRAQAAVAAEKAKARAEVERLERELAAAKALLRGDRPVTGGAATPPAATVAGVESKAVRAWAREHDVECPTHGRVPRAVVQQYVADTRGAAA